MATQTTGPRPQDERSAWFRYGVAVFAVAMAGALRVWFSPFFGTPAYFLFFYPAIALTALFAGFGPGLLATGLAAALASFWMRNPLGGPVVPFTAQAFKMLAFVLLNLLVVWACQRMRGAIRQAAQARAAWEKAEIMAKYAETLRSSEERLRTTFEHAGVGIFELNKEDRVAAVNGRGCEILGYPREELLGVRLDDLTAPEDRELSARLNAQVREAGRDRIDYEKRCLKRDGSPLWVRVTLSAVRDAEGRWASSIGTFEDISERKQAEESLKQSEAQLRQIIDLVPHFIFIKDWNGKILLANKAQADAYNSMSADLAGKSQAELHKDENELRRMLRDDREVMATGRAKFIPEETFVDAQGHRRLLQTTKVPFYGLGKETPAVLGIALDITEAKRIENALKQAKESAEAANRAKEQFIAVLSHELRTPLMPVLATVTALEIDEAVSPNMREDMETIRRNVEMEAKLIDDLLDVTRISQGKLPLYLEALDAHSCLQSALQICQAEIEAKHLAVRLGLSAPLHHVWADSTRLRQVFWNLLKNAVKFTPEHGAISLSSFNEDSRLKIEVADTGIGIDPAVLPRIFKAFEQGEQSRTRQFGGLGLGLSIAKAVVETQGGLLTAFSEGKNKGAAFTVDLPTTAPVQETPAPAPAPALQKEQPCQILLVDDHADTLHTMARLLRRWGYRVTTATNVHDALEVAANGRFDLLVSDLGLPDGSGLEIIHRVKELYGLHGIALSGYGTDEDVRRSREAGFDDHLVKPVSFQALRESIQRITSKLNCIIE